ncbi:hypothetical protein FHS95_000236 [Sphingomonas naasensis]|uniref:Uncharacterized protein n=1 Tax=Sphingomonas naasensis TaxID=1344951 RepID=A0A4S1WU31_9SPHN|nr:hypothetical protein [Sphingomonas naasensis]NIJ18567.1 hypothetical protein [Sphingomonas naasensis]TGX45817.1 hypothetical protein E5A74_01145 [Sphingomonas naasensis]
MLLALLLSLAGQADPEVDPLVHAREGRMQCIAPDSTRRTCRTLVRYTLQGERGFDAVVTGLVSTEPVAILEYRTSGTIEDGAICSVVRPIDLRDGKLSKDGAPLSPAIEAQVRARLMSAVQPLAGHRRCYRQQFDGTEYQSHVTIDGLLRTEMTQRSLWVRPDDGYAVAP